MANDRTFYACQAVAIAVQKPSGTAGTFTEPASGDYQFLHGVQSVGLNTSFEFDNIFELGQLEIYDSVLQVPQIEITLEKVLDNHPTVYTVAAPSGNLLTDSKNRLSVMFAIYKDSENAGVSAPLHMVKCTGMYVNNVSYTFPVEGQLTESVTLVGNHKAWSTTAIANIPSGIADRSASTVDEPIGGSVLTRRDVGSMTLPHGTSKVQSITMGVDLGREDLLQLGQKVPYARIPNYPVEVTAEVEYLVDENNMETVSFDENTNELPEQNVSLAVTAGYYAVNLGNKCFLKSVTYGGGDASGGNATVTYSYSTYNTFGVTYGTTTTTTPAP
jgi:hypothetical protein